MQIGTLPFNNNTELFKDKFLVVIANGSPPHWPCRVVRMLNGADGSPDKYMC